ncbi:hypothetical protein ACET3Z_013981 [Daucus carota]
MPQNITIDPKCQSKCGDLTVPYPFGIVSKDRNCSIDPSFDITCDDSFNPPKAFIQTGNIQVYDISDTELRVSNFVSYKCYNQTGFLIDHEGWSINMYGTPYLYSDANVFTVVGCDDFGSLFRVENSLSRKGCITTCDNAEDVDKDECSGNGCCQTSLNLDKYFEVGLSSDFKHKYNVSSFNPCGYAFFGEIDKFKFQGTSDLIDPAFRNRTAANVPIVLDWGIGNKSCSQVDEDSNSKACSHENTYCINETRSGGYRCSCKKGYEGNPYLSPGCTDIDECTQNRTDNCEQICNNNPGNYTCSCWPGYYTDVDDKTKCIVEAKSSKPQPIKFILGMGFSCLIIIIGMNWLYCINRKRRDSKLREKYFHQNGGLLLRQQSTSEGGAIESTKHFTYEELKNATNNYASDRILGQGGYGVVYKGILPDESVVAIKKSKILDKTQVEQFINEVRILTQVKHKNVVKLLGCCLECEVPMLVYEFVSNGTLFHHVHNVDGAGSWLSLENRLRIAAESSGALAYLHSAVSIPIIHRDVKLANILLDDNHVAKIADFGASRLIPMDQTEVSTLVQGTLGYLDPEYFHTGQLTEKSDVYSFGIVFAELLTGRQPICMANRPEERNLATHFVSSLKEDRLFQIIDPRLLKEGTIDQLQKAAQLVKRCLSLNGEGRPTMKEVMMEVESFRKFTKHPWTNQHGNEDTARLIGQNEFPHSDLYEIQLSSYHNVVNDSEQYSSSTTISLLRPPTSPR